LLFKLSLRKHKVGLRCITAIRVLGREHVALISTSITLIRSSRSPPAFPPAPNPVRLIANPPASTAIPSFLEQAYHRLMTLNISRTRCKRRIQFIQQIVLLDPPRYLLPLIHITRLVLLLLHHCHLWLLLLRRSLWHSIMRVQDETVGGGI